MFVKGYCNVIALIAPIIEPTRSHIDEVLFIDL